ncbi:MAG: SMP-30/gluconolactonase/LRE family protein [Pseudomonadota bacterium]
MTTTAAPEPTTLLEGIHFGEGPRVHGDWFYFSDMHAHRVQRLNLRYLSAGEPAATLLETVIELDGPCSGLGWLPNGDLLIVEMEPRRLLRWDGEQLRTHADLGALAAFHCNDMVVDRNGRAYVGNFGFDLHAGATPAPANLVCVSPAGEVSLAAADLMFPNGTVITPDDRTLIVGETFGACLTAFARDDEGRLNHRRTWAQLPEGAVPDGICLDAANGIWVASPTTAECLRIVEGGTVTHRVPTGDGAFACMLADSELFILTAADSHPERCRDTATGRLLRLEAPYPAAGWP